MYKIEKGIEMPRKRNGYPFDAMNVGDSFEFPREKQRHVSSAMIYFTKKNGGKFTTRINGDVGRCWRIE